MAIVTFYNCDPKDAPKTTMPAHLGANAIITCQGKLLLEKRRDSDIWGMIGGGCKKTETGRDAIAREVYDLLARTVARMICAGAEKTGINQVLIAGGVSSSKLFRELVTERIHKRDRDLRVCFGKPEFSGDNAVGTALIGAQMLRESEM